MSAIIYGQRLCGKVDRIPGICYVTTMFFHIDYLNLIPTASYIVIEGTEVGNDFRGTKVPLRGRSVLAGYIRNWLGIATFLAAIFVGFAVCWLFHGLNGKVLVEVLAAAACAGLYAFVMMGPSRPAALVLSALILAAVGFWAWTEFLMPKPNFGNLRTSVRDVLGALFLTNLGAFLFTLTRLWNIASYERALAIAEVIGVPREMIDAIYTADPMAEAHSAAMDEVADTSWATPADTRALP